MKNTQEIRKSIVVLVVICLLTSAALAVVNHFTAPVSAANAAAREQQARLDAVPEAASFEPIDLALPDGVVGAYTALDASGAPISYLFTVEGKGFGGTIQVLCVIGVSAISGATITSTAYRGCVETAFEAFELVKEAQK